MTTQEFIIYKNMLLKISACLESDLIHLKIAGPAAPVVNLCAREVVEFFDGQHPARIEQDTLYLSTWLPPIPGKSFSRLLRSQIKNQISESLRKLNISLPASPEQVTISITEECPNRCIHCALPDTGQKTQLSLSTIKDIIDQAVAMGATLIIFDGGEPMAYDGLEEAVAYVPEGAVSTVFTSGYGLTSQKARALSDAGLYAVNISLDSPLEEEHDRIRGRQGVFGDALSAIRHSLDAGLLVNIYVVIAPHNINDLDRFYELAAQTGVHELSFYEIVPTGRWLDREKDVLSPQHHRLLDDFVKKRKNGQVRVCSIPHLLKITGCFAGRRWLHVTPEGDVLPCACIPIPYGNILQRPLKSIWRGMQNTGLYQGGPCLMRDDDFRAKHLD